MPLQDTIRVVNSRQRRIKLFVDFWNVVINARKQCKNFDVEVRWEKLAEHLVSETRQGFSDETTGELAGCYIFGSVSRSNAQETKFVDGVLDQYGSNSGLFFNFAERIQKQTSVTCSDCGQSIKARSESGVDVLLAVEMIKHAAMREHEYLALVSSDRDFVPLLSFLRDQGQRVLHIATGGPDRDMRSVTWAQVNLPERYPSLCRIRHDGYIVLTAPPFAKELEQIMDAAPVEREKIRVIDVSYKAQIGNKDMDFLLSNLGLFWKRGSVGRLGRHETILSHRHYADNLDKFRQDISKGDLRGNLPYVLRNGTCETYFNGHNSSYPWVQMSDGDAGRRWSKLFKRE
jgi:uncharacterized LabA/DUF88 family protein